MEPASLHKAARMGDLDIAQWILDRGSDVNVKDRNGRTPLHLAVERGKIEVAELLVNSGADVDARDNSGKSPLHFAAERGRVRHFDQLWGYGANVNGGIIASWSQIGYTPPNLAVEQGCDDIFTFLLNRSADVDAKDRDGTTPLCLAVAFGKIESAELLVKRGADVDARDNSGKSSLHFAAEYGRVRYVELLLKYGANVNVGITASGRKKGYTPLHLAVEQGHEDIVTLLLNKSADVDAKAEDATTPLHIAATLGYGNVVCLLLQHGANVDHQDKYGKTVLYRAVSNGCLAIVENVLKYFPDGNNQSNRRSLRIAVCSRTKDAKKVIQSLLEYGFSVDPEDAKYPDLLHGAVEKGCLNIVEYLVTYGADVNGTSKSYDDYTPLHIAAMYKREEVAEFLIRYGADVNFWKNWKTPIFHAIEKADIKTTNVLLTGGANVKNEPELLHLAVKKESKEIVEALLLHGADINATDRWGRTALHFTADGVVKGSYYQNKNNDDITKGELAELLLSKGASVDAWTESGVTPLYAASEKGYSGVVEVLLARGANVNAKDTFGTTALYAAMNSVQKDVVDLLLKCGAEVDANTRYCVPKYLSVVARSEEIVETYLGFGFDIDSRNELGETAVYIASLKGRTTVVETLLACGADIDITAINDFTVLYSEFGGAAEAFKRHIVKLKAANLYVSERNLFILRLTYREFQEECAAELASMKNCTINDTNISFHDILTKSPNALELCLRNEEIVQVLKADDYKTKFPLYAGTIKRSFRKGMQRKELIEKGNAIFRYLLKLNNIPVIPHDCMEIIFSYLTNEDFKILMDACEPVGLNDLDL